MADSSSLAVGRLNNTNIVSPENNRANAVSFQARLNPARCAFSEFADMRIEFATAMPSAAPTCRALLLRADPIANFCRGRNAVAELEIVEIHSPTPIPV